MVAALGGGATAPPAPLVQQLSEGRPLVFDRSQRMK